MTALLMALIALLVVLLLLHRRERRCWRSLSRRCDLVERELIAAQALLRAAPAATFGAGSAGSSRPGRSGQDRKIPGRRVARRRLGLSTIACSVESDGQLTRLAELGCDQAFGCCLSRALAPAALDVLLERWPQRSGPQRSRPTAR